MIDANGKPLTTGRRVTDQEQEPTVVWIFVQTAAGATPGASVTPRRGWPLACAPDVWVDPLPRRF